MQLTGNLTVLISLLVLATHQVSAAPIAPSGMSDGLVSRSIGVDTSSIERRAPSEPDVGGLIFRRDDQPSLQTRDLTSGSLNWGLSRAHRMEKRDLTSGSLNWGLSRAHQKEKRDLTSGSLNWGLSRPHQMEKRDLTSGSLNWGLSRAHRMEKRGSWKAIVQGSKNVVKAITSVVSSPGASQLTRMAAPPPNTPPPPPAVGGDPQASSAPMDTSSNTGS